MDVTEWNPKTDKYLPVKYDKTSAIEGKAAAKAALQAELGLPVDPSAPLFGYIGRLEEQKGVDILLAVRWAGVTCAESCPPARVAVLVLLSSCSHPPCRRLLRPLHQALPKLAGTNAQIAILGTGKAKYEQLVKQLATKQGNFKGVVKFSAPLAHQITAGADFILVPSRCVHWWGRCLAGAAGGGHPACLGRSTDAHTPRSRPRDALLCPLLTPRACATGLSPAA